MPSDSISTRLQEIDQPDDESITFEDSVQIICLFNKEEPSGGVEGFR